MINFFKMSIIWLYFDIWRKSFEYELEFQIVFDDNIAIRVFRNGFEKGVAYPDWHLAPQVC